MSTLREREASGDGSVTILPKSVMTERATSKRTRSVPAEEWLSMLKGAAIEVSETMLGGGLADAEPHGSVIKADVTAMVGLAGAIVGVVAVRCSVATARQIASRMVGTEVGQTDAAARDALGEVCNMIAGLLKSKLPAIENLCLLSTPTIVMGHDFSIYPLGKGPSVQIPFSFEGSRLWVSLDVQN